MTMTLDSDEDEVFVRLHAVEEKWKIIFQQEPRAPLLPVKYYVENIRKYLARKDKQNDLIAPREGSALSQLLKKLKLDLKMAYSWFLSEFVGEPYQGISMLIDVLKEAQNELNNNKSASLSKKHDHQKRALADEYGALLCLKFATGHMEGLQKLIKHPSGLTVVASCLVSSFSQSRIVSLELLSRALDIVNGYENVLQALTQLRLRLSESVRFKFLISMLNNQGNAFISFQVICMTFLNRLLSSAPSMNHQVYLQTELEEAGLDISILEKICNKDSKEHLQLKEEVNNYKKKYINVKELCNKIQDLHNTTDKLKGEIKFLRDNVQRLTDDKMHLMRIEKELSDQVNDFQQQMQVEEERLPHKESDELSNHITFDHAWNNDEENDESGHHAVRDKINRFESLQCKIKAENGKSVLHSDNKVSPSLKYYFGAENKTSNNNYYDSKISKKTQNLDKKFPNYQVSENNGFSRGTRRLDSDSGHSTHSTDSAVISSDLENAEKEIMLDFPPNGVSKLNVMSSGGIKSSSSKESKQMVDSGFSSPLTPNKPKRTLADKSRDSFESTFDFNFILRKQPFNHSETIDHHKKLEGLKSSFSYESQVGLRSLYHPNGSAVICENNVSFLNKNSKNLLDKQIEEALNSVEVACDPIK